MFNKLGLRHLKVRYQTTEIQALSLATKLKSNRNFFEKRPGRAIQAKTKRCLTKLKPAIIKHCSGFFHFFDFH